MSARKFTLGDFIKLSPVCQEHANLKEVLGNFLKGGHEEIALVNSQNFPTGTLHYRSLIPCILKKEALESISSLEIEPIVIFPARMSVERFSAYWRSQNPSKIDPCFWQKSCALVKDSGEFVGLLDIQSLIKFLARGEGEYKNQVENNSTATSQKSLFSVLEKLPLPLKLETDRGVALYQNLSWREKVEGEKNRESLTVSSEEFEEKSQEVAVNIALERNVDRVGQNNDLWEFVKLPIELSNVGRSQPKTDEDLARAENLKIVSSQKNRAETREAIETETKTAKNSIWLILANELTREQKLERDKLTKDSDRHRLNRLKDDLLASIAHELKSPITAIVGLSNLLQEKKIGQLNQRQNRYTEQIYQSGQQLMQLVNQLLDLTALETGQLKLSPETVNIKNICDRAWRSIEGKYQDLLNFKEIQLNIEIEKDLDEVVADELRLHQILVYLLENALLCLSSGGKISLRVTSFYSDWIAITIKYKGELAIPEEVQYLATFQLLKSGNSSLAESKNSGLGLVLSDRLAKAQGGDLSFISSVTRGNEFNIFLPAPESRQKHSFIKSDRLVLVVESIAPEIDNLTDRLQNLGYKYIIARSGTEALSKAKKFQPEAIFLNPALPLLGGWEVLQSLKSDLDTKNIPVYVTSTKSDRDSSIAKGANGFLSLPVKKHSLEKILIARDRDTPVQTQNLTILCLYAIPEKSGCVSAIVNHQLHGLNHRILEADSIEQAEILARIWKIDAIVLEGTFLDEPRDFLRSFCECPSLAAVPLVTMDAKTTEAANQFKQLSVFPCLVPLPDRGYSNLLEVIQIAAKLDR